MPAPPFLTRGAARRSIARDIGTRGWLLLGASCVNAGAISWAGINAQAYVTATTFMVLTNVNKFAVIAFGIFVLGESRSWQAVVGCCTALGGGLWYARARSNLAEASRRRAEQEALKSEPLVAAEDGGDDGEADGLQPRR